jgi:hypothetical protein
MLSITLTRPPHSARKSAVPVCPRDRTSPPGPDDAGRADERDEATQERGERERTPLWHARDQEPSIAVERWIPRWRATTAPPPSRPSEVGEDLDRVVGRQRHHRASHATSVAPSSSKNTARPASGDLKHDLRGCAHRPMPAAAAVPPCVSASAPIPSSRGGTRATSGARAAAAAPEVLHQRHMPPRRRSRRALDDVRDLLRQVARHEHVGSTSTSATAKS